MVKKQDKRKRDIKSKLMAAICMLLVSSIMMVSSTYAWFTLSTAPEVTGITTAVGANGNLEMALLPSTGALADITTDVGDSVKAIVERNITWGNLVDLSDTATYGLDKIVLNPAQLNMAAEGVLGATLLAVPAYGADGRISEMKADTVTGVFADNSFPQNDSVFGVRAVGTANGMTDRQLAYRNARSTASTAMAQAKNLAANSLSANGKTLANVAIAHAADSDAMHSETDLTAMKAIVNDLLKDDGILDKIEKAYIQYIIAYGASQTSLDGGMDDVAFKAFQTALEGAADLEAALGMLTTHHITLPTELYGTDASPINKLLATIANVEDAQGKLNALTDTDNNGYAWGEISPALTLLANPDNLMVGDIPAKDVKENINEVAANAANLTVYMETGGGVYADVADHCGDYNVAITLDIKYGGFDLKDIKARMATRTSANPLYLVAVGSAVQAAGAPAGTGQVMPITNMYGYVVDLAFRTNASESDLLLQTSALNRIYAEGGSEETMGHGSTMTFAATTTDFSDEQVKNLMECIRLVFYVPAADTSEQNTVLAYGKLNVYGGDAGTTDLTTTTADGITADIVLYTMEAQTTTTYTKVEAGQPAGEYKLVDGSDSQYELVADYNAVEGNTAWAGDTYTATTTTGSATETVLEGKDAVITALTQNVAQKVSVLVYLDGASITNADVAATAATSVEGKMNLQFSSSATLVPMDYIDYMAQGTGTNSSNNSQGTNP